MVVFITKEYMRKVNLPNDNCALEFKYACNTKMNTEIVPVAMERECTNNRGWTGRVALELGGLLFINMSEAVTRERVQELAKHIDTVVKDTMKELVDMWFDDLSQPESILDWLLRVVGPNKAEQVCAVLLEAGLGTVKALLEQCRENPQYLNDLEGVDSSDISSIVKACSSEQ